MGGGGKSKEMPLEYTPTWVVASVCTVIVVISLALERLLHILGKYLKKKNKKPLYEALQKVKEELMLLGFISLLLTVFQGAISRICITESLMLHMLPCKMESKHAKVTEHFESFFFSGISGSGRRLLSGGSSDITCPAGKVPMFSLEALHQLHIFIFVLAIAHVVFCVLTMILGGARIQQWKHWEDAIAQENYDTDKDKEMHRRQDMLANLRSRANQTASMLNMSNFANREDLLGQNQKPVSEINRTTGLDNYGLVGLQRQIMKEQDEGLEKLEETVFSTKHIALAVNEELDLHTRLIDNLDQHVDSTDSRLQRVQKRLAILNKRTKGGCSCMCLLLAVIGIVILAVIIWALIKYL